MGSENAKGVEHFKKFKKSIEDLVKATTHVHDHIDNRGIENKILKKKIGKLEERCDTLTEQVWGVILNQFNDPNNISLLGCFFDLVV